MTASAADLRMERALAMRGLLPADELTGCALETSVWTAGYPPVPLPAEVAEGVARAIQAGETHYTARPGLPALRRRVAERLTAAGAPVDAGGVVITAGAQEARFVLLAVLAKDSRVALAEPAHPGYAQALRRLGRSWHRLPGDPERGFLPDPAALADLSPEVGLVVAASPHPLTGAAYNARDVEALAGALGDRILIWDASLAPYAGETVHPGRFAPEAAVFTVGSLAPPFGLQAWRIGFFAGPADRIAPARDLKQAMSVCTSAMAQYAALAALERPDAEADALRETLNRHRARLVEALSAWGAEVLPGGSPYVAFRLPRGRMLDVPSVPGSLFGEAAAGVHRLTVPLAARELDALASRLAAAEGGERT